MKFFEDNLFVLLYTVLFVLVMVMAIHMMHHSGDSPSVQWIQGVATGILASIGILARTRGGGGGGGGDKAP